MIERKANWIKVALRSTTLAAAIVGAGRLAACAPTGTPENPVANPTAITTPEAPRPTNMPSPTMITERPTFTPEPTISPTRTPEATKIPLRDYIISVRDNESFESILGFYGLNSRDSNWEFLQKDKLLLRIEEERYSLPYKKISMPGISISISPWTEKWDLGEAGYGDLIAYSPDFPYSFYGHTRIDSKKKEDLDKQGSFAGLRELKIGDKIYFSRTWLGEDGDWLEAQVVRVVSVMSAQEQTTIEQQSNSGLINLVTCLVEEESNPDARLVVQAKVINYNSSNKRTKYNK